MRPIPIIIVLGVMCFLVTLLSNANSFVDLFTVSLLGYIISAIDHKEKK